MIQGTNHFEDLPEGDGVLILSPSRQILSSTLQTERLLKRKLSRGQTLSLKDLFGEQYLAQAELALKEALKAGVSRANLMAQVNLEPGLNVFLNYAVAPLYNQEDRIIGAILTFRDNTLTRAWSAWSNNGLEVPPEAVFEHFDRGVFTVDSRWRITTFNKLAEEITGFSRQEVLGHYCWDIFKADRCRAGCFLKATLEDGVTRTDQDVHIVHKAGRRLTILVSSSAIKNRREAIVGAVQTFRPLARTPGPGAELTPPPRKVEIIGQSPVLRQLLHLLPDVAASEATVVLEGESGSGKDLFALAIHQQSPWARGPFVAFNCSALVETLIESELFGHVKGAFTGAISNKVGRLELAKGGTLFLDEIGDLKLELQTKLLRVLEERFFKRVGSNRPIPLEARVIAATSRNLVQEVRLGRFRMDLLYRLRTVPLYLPPLRERQEDVPLLVNHFVARLNRKYKKEVKGVDPKVMTMFQQYAWPGNVRELERVLEYAFVFVKGPIITKAHLPELEAPPSPAPAPGWSPDGSKAPHLWEDERLTIEKALNKARGRREEAARLLGISRSSLWRKMKAYGLV
jgi:PAS domain S-box-containing protein